MVIKVTGLSKSFKNKMVLKNINIELQEGETVILLGPSGAGKTTILRCICGLEKCDSGSIEINGEYLCRDENGRSIYPSKRKLFDIRRNIGLVFQSFNLFPHMSVLQNIIEAPVNGYAIKREKAEGDALLLLNKMGLVDKKDSYPFELSGGQKQRVAIARACALSPKVICFDEPTSALDLKSTQEVAAVIKELSNEGIGVLIITHDREFAEMTGGRVVRIEDGLIR